MAHGDDNDDGTVAHVTKQRQQKTGQSTCDTGLLPRYRRTTPDRNAEDEAIHKRSKASSVVVLAARNVSLLQLFAQIILCTRARSCLCGERLQTAPPAPLDRALKLHAPSAGTVATPPPAKWSSLSSFLCVFFVSLSLSLSFFLYFCFWFLPRLRRPSLRIALAVGADKWYRPE